MGTDIILENINLRFNSNYIFQHSINFHTNKKVSLINGPNGAGKTVLGKLLTGLYTGIFNKVASSSGKFISPVGIVLVNNFDKYNPNLYYYHPQATDIIMVGSTVFSNLLLISSRNGFNMDRFHYSINLLKAGYLINDFKKRAIATYSRGEKQKIMLSILYSLNPNFLFLDEPDSFLDSDGIIGLKKIVYNLINDQSFFFISSHNQSEYNSFKPDIINLDIKITRNIPPIVINDHNHKQKLIEVKNQTIKISKKVSIRIQKFNFFSHTKTIVYGNNGSGKSSLLRSLHENRIKIKVCKNYYNLHSIFITEEPDNQLFFRSIDYEISINIQNFGISIDEIYYSALKFLGNFNKQISELSWGQRKFLLVVLALASKKKIIILDEPFVGLDTHYSNALNSLINYTINFGCSIIFSTNNINRHIPFNGQRLKMNHHLLIPEYIYD